MTAHPDRRRVLQGAALLAAASALPSTTFATENPMTDAMHDFDFFHGSWSVKHRFLKERLKNCHDWIEFTGTSVCVPTMAGAGNMDDNVIAKPDITYRAMTVRMYDPATKLWAIWWFDGRMPLGPKDPPLKGSFKDGVGTFVAPDDHWEGQKIMSRFLWSNITKTSCRWEQSFSTDGGQTWEVNWVMESTRTA
jgi:hypothetical protein